MAAVELVALPAIKRYLGINPKDPAENDFLNDTIVEVSAAIESYCHRHFGLALYTEYHDGLNTPLVALNQRPTQQFAITGTTTLGSPVVTGLSGFLTGVTPFVSQAVLSPTNLLQATSVLSVDSATQVTLAANATVSGATTLTFAAAVWLNTTGYAGQAPGPLPASALLLPGVDYMIVVDGDDNSGESGLLQRVAGVQSGFPFLWEYGATHRNTLTAAALPYWPQGMRNIRAKYWAGFPTIPAPVQLACKMAVGRVRSSRPLGSTPGGFSYRGYSFSGSKMGGDGGILGKECMRLLAPYREVSFGSQ